jgi:hypothetical protein
MAHFAFVRWKFYDFVILHFIVLWIQAGGEILLSAIHKLINSVWNKEELPDQWKESIIRDLSSSPSIIRIVKSRRMRWAGHIAQMGEKSNAYRLLVGKPEGKNH